MFDYDIAYEDDSRAVVSIDIRGHVSEIEADLFLAEISRDPTAFDLDEDHWGAWEVERMWRSTQRSDDGSWDMYFHHCVRQSDADEPVTRLLVMSDWGRTCAFHPKERADTGLPYARYGVLEPDARTEEQPMGAYIHVCWRCRILLNRRLSEFERQRTQEADRRRAAGVPEALVYA